MAENETLTAWLAERVADHVRLPVAEIRADVLLAEYGMDSVHAVALSADIEDRCGLLTDPAVVWEHPTIDALADFLAGELAVAAQERVD